MSSLTPQKVDLEQPLEDGVTTSRKSGLRDKNISENYEKEKNFATQKSFFHSVINT